jgi:hypothetical protein
VLLLQKASQPAGSLASAGRPEKGFEGGGVNVLSLLGGLERAAEVAGRLGGARSTSVRWIEVTGMP